MRDFKNWGVKIRWKENLNYYSIWYNLKTIRLDLGETIPLPPKESEFYDVGVTERCNLGCPFCYVSSGPEKEDYRGICEAWERWISSFSADTTHGTTSPDPIFQELRESEIRREDGLELSMLKVLFRVPKIPVTYTEKPFQVAIGSTGEPTIHPDLPRFLKTVWESGVVPNYTTNGIILADSPCPELISATRDYCGGVAVSFGNRSIREKAEKAVKRLLLEGEVKVMIHHLISDRESVNQFIRDAKEWGKDIHYHVLLPLMPHGRSKTGMGEDSFLYLREVVRKEGIMNLAFGANFAPYLEKYPGSFNLYDYPKEAYSKNILLKDSGIEITPSSFDIGTVLWKEKKEEEN